MNERKKGDGGRAMSDPIEDALAPVRDLASFEAAAEAFGGDLAFWPPARRVEAQALLERGGPAADAARRALAEEAEFDALLGEASFSDTRISDAQMRRFMAGAERAAPGFLEHLSIGAVKLFLRLADRLGEQISPDRGLRVSTADFGLRSLGGLGAAAAVAGVVFGLYGPLATSQSSVQTAASESGFFETGGGDEELDFFIDELAFDSRSEREVDG